MAADALDTIDETIRKPAAERASNLADSAKGKASETVEQGKQTMQSAKKQTNDKLSDMADDAISNFTQEGASEGSVVKRAPGSARSLAENTSDKVSEAAQRGQENMYSTKEAASDKASDMAQRGKEKIYNAKESAAGKASDVAQQGNEKIVHAKEAVSDKASEIAQRGKETMRDAQEAVQSDDKNGGKLSDAIRKDNKPLGQQSLDDARTIGETVVEHGKDMLGRVKDAFGMGEGARGKPEDRPKV